MSAFSSGKSYRQMTRHEREVFDAFYGGVCVTLSAAGYLMNGTSPEYLEAVGAVGPRDLLNYAIRQRDMELSRIRAAVRCIEGKRRRAEPRTPTVTCPADSAGSPSSTPPQRGTK